jgi:uncharacterized protein DUF4242
MTNQAAADAVQSFLVEHYRPGLHVDELRRSAARIRDTALELQREGKPVRHVRTTIVPSDESFLCVFEAASEELVRETYARAGIPFERISTALPEEG